MSGLDSGTTAALLTDFAFSSNGSRHALTRAHVDSVFSVRGTHNAVHFDANNTDVIGSDAATTDRWISRDLALFNTTIGGDVKIFGRAIGDGLSSGEAFGVDFVLALFTRTFGANIVWFNPRGAKVTFLVVLVNASNWDAFAAASVERFRLETIIAGGAW